MTVRAVLWDADGVLQEMPPVSDPSAVLAVLDEIPGYLVGAPVDEDLVSGVLDRLGLGEHRDEVLRVWSTFPALADAHEVVAAVRAAGLLAEPWHHRDGVDVLRDLLGRHGVFT